MCVCAHAWLSGCVIGSGGWWGSREALERVYFPPAARGEGNHLLMPSSETYTQKEEVSHVIQSTVASQTDCCCE